jgi:small subunit ribosomal protein S15
MPSLLPRKPEIAANNPLKNARLLSRLEDEMLGTVRMQARQSFSSASSRRARVFTSGPRDLAGTMPLRQTILIYRFACIPLSVLPSEALLNEKRQECNRLVLAREQKQSVVDTYRTHPTDTGSPEVQIALLSERIGQLTEHFKTHQKDHGSRRGLLMMVSRRRSLLDYLKKYDSERYKTVISKLGIRK